MLDAMMGARLSLFVSIWTFNVSVLHADMPALTDIPSLLPLRSPLKLEPLLVGWRIMFPCELYAIEESALLSIYPELTLQETEREPVLQRGGGCYVPVV